MINKYILNKQKFYRGNGLWPDIPKIQKLLSFDDLLKEIEKGKSVLNKEAIDYLYSLLNLETSVLHKFNINDKTEYLSQLQLFKQLVIYNLYHKYSNVVDRTNDKYHFTGTEYNYFSISMFGKHLFQLDFTEDMTDLILFTSESVLSVEQKREALLKKLENARGRLENEKNTFCPYTGKDAYGNILLGGPATQWAFENASQRKKLTAEIEKISKITDDELKVEFENDSLVSESRNSIIKSILNDNYLTDTDFEEQLDQKGNKYKVKKYGYANIIIY